MAFPNWRGEKARTNAGPLFSAVDLFHGRHGQRVRSGVQALVIGLAHLKECFDFPRVADPTRGAGKGIDHVPIGLHLAQAVRSQRAHFEHCRNEVFASHEIRQSQWRALSLQLLQSVARPGLWRGMQEAPLPRRQDQLAETFPKKFACLAVNSAICMAKGLFFIS
jgi:hypothetical protein